MTPHSRSHSGHFPGRARTLLLLCVAALAGCDLGGDSKSPDSAGQSKMTAGSWLALPAVEAEHYQDLSAVRLGRAVVIVAAASGTQGRLELLVFDMSSRRWRTTTSPMRWRVDPSVTPAEGQLIVWGGCCGAADEGNTAEGMRYDPIEDKWRELAGSPLSRRTGHSAAWTGEEMIVWGGVPAGERATTSSCCQTEPPTTQKQTAGAASRMHRSDPASEGAHRRSGPARRCLSGTASTAPPTTRSGTRGGDFPMPPAG